MYAEETGLYYLRSRYYDSAQNRFSNMDSVLNAGILYTNQQAYCANNPIIFSDSNGRNPGEDSYDEDQLPGSIFLDICGCYQVNIPSSAVWSNFHSTPLMDGMWYSGLTGVNAADIWDSCHAASGTAPYTASKVYDPNAIKTGWHVGENIFNLTFKGDKPTWSTIRSRYWKNEYYYNKGSYSPLNQDRMKRGLAPLDRDGNPFHLHHPYGREGDNYYVFGPIEQAEHLEIHRK